MWWENNPHAQQSVSKLDQHTVKSRKNASLQITAHIFFSFPKGMAQTI